jgi:hypothetical protein
MIHRRIAVPARLSHAGGVAFHSYYQSRADDMSGCLFILPQMRATLNNFSYALLRRTGIEQLLNNH